jgi:hypothetical protein
MEKKISQIKRGTMGFFFQLLWYKALGYVIPPKWEKLMKSTLGEKTLIKFPTSFVEKLTKIYPKRSIRTFIVVIM